MPDVEKGARGKRCSIRFIPEEEQINLGNIDRILRLNLGQGCGTVARYRASAVCDARLTPALRSAQFRMKPSRAESFPPRDLNEWCRQPNRQNTPSPTLTLK